jgi:hypothetical protein
MAERQTVAMGLLSYFPRAAAGLRSKTAGAPVLVGPRPP